MFSTVAAFGMIGTQAYYSHIAHGCVWSQSFCVFNCSDSNVGSLVGCRIDNMAIPERFGHGSIRQDMDAILSQSAKKVNDTFLQIMHVSEDSASKNRTLL